MASNYENSVRDFARQAQRRQHSKCTFFVHADLPGQCFESRKDVGRAVTDLMIKRLNSLRS